MRPLRRCFIAIFMNKNCLFSQTLAFRNPLKCPFSTALKTYSDDARVFFASGKIDVKGWNLTATKQEFLLLVQLFNDALEGRRSECHE